jgi:hypothetical protein
LVSFQGLKYPGFLMTLLSIVATRDGDASNPEKTEFFIRQQASVMFKRTVARGWTCLSKEKTALISDADKAAVRGGIISVSPGRLCGVCFWTCCTALGVVR